MKNFERLRPFSLPLQHFKFSTDIPFFFLNLFQDIDKDHEYYAFKYIKDKPVSDLKGDMFLQIHKAKEEGYIEITIGIDLGHG